VARIRRKLGDEAGEPTYIRTVHGVGYAFKEEAGSN
jgi:DNA-binding response OmpR family regulator